jgi:hypothetical protein
MYAYTKQVMQGMQMKRAEIYTGTGYHFSTFLISYFV